MKYSISVILGGLILLTLIPSVYGQDLTIGQKAEQKLVQVEIDLDGNIHAKHVIYPLDSPGSITLIEGTVSNVVVKDQDGNEIQFGTATGNSILLFPSKDYSIVEYDLSDVLILKDQFWNWNLKYLQNVSVILPQEIDLIYVNNNPIEISVADGINCHGCFMNLEYSLEEPKILQQALWEDKEFLVEIRSMSDINQFNFNQPSKSISFEIIEKDTFVTVVIPLELLWEPYTVFLNEKKITQHEFSNATHVWVTMKSENPGIVSIVGTTVIPEFPLIAPLALAFSIIILMPFVGRAIRH